MTTAFFSYDHLNLRYEPFPIGLAKPVMEDGLYRELVRSYPPVELFQYMPKIGKKYSLSERNNPDRYAAFLKDTPVWQGFRDWIKSEAFVIGVLQALKARSVDLGLDKPLHGAKLARKVVANLRRGRLGTGEPRLRARFEFSMLPADGGSVIPHTDAPGKLITLVISMVDDGGWDQAFGGGTDVNRPKDPKLTFNELNRQAGFDEMEVLDSFAFTPNQAVVFVKTFNSWHSVRPMTGTNGAMRKTLTINIEDR